jgi:hypothetical protein
MKPSRRVPEWLHVGMQRRAIRVVARRCVRSQQPLKIEIGSLG